MTEEADLLKMIEECDEILSKDSSNAKAYLDRGSAECNLAAEYIDTSKEKMYLEKAIADFNKVIDLTSDKSLLQEAHHEIGNAYSEIEQHEEAVKHFTAAIEITSDVHALTPLYLSRSCSYQELGEEELANTDHEKYEALVKVTRG
ncbi:tetratricopeptide repeat protein [Candidatus Woesearchaeota archaeon]|nr:tetratricopeptide repeat protein [Candidatus Woesearchaeota archaeon]